RDREELRQVLAIALRDRELAVVADGPRELRQCLVELARRGDERVISQRRDRRLGLGAPRLWVEDPLDAVVEPDERELPGEDLLRERAATPLVLELHQLIRRRQRVVPLRH